MSKLDQQDSAASRAIITVFNLAFRFWFLWILGWAAITLTIVGIAWHFVAKFW